jgi:hypothetical protein
MSIKNRILLQRGGRNQFDITDDDITELNKEFERRQALSPAEREAEDTKRKQRIATEKKEAAKIRKKKKEEENIKKANEEARAKEFFARMGVPDWTPIDPHFSMSHSEYLETSLWRKIRRRILKRDLNICRICSAKASIVHHHSYDYEVICGTNEDELVSLCKRCHKRIEFDDEGRHRTVEEKRIVFEKMMGEQGTD